MLLKATGDAPILKQNKFKISAHEKFEKVVSFLGAQLGKKQIFVYLNSAFRLGTTRPWRICTSGTAWRGSSW